MKPNILLMYLLQLLFISCADEIETTITNSNEDVVITSSQHLGFPDLTWYHDYWYITFRISDAHVGGTYSKIMVLKSPNFKTWEENSIYESPEFDLRDPKFSYNEKTDSLYLHFHGASIKDTYGQIRKNIYLNYSDKIYEKYNSIERFKELALPQEYKFDWLWRPIWHEGKLFAGGYRHDQFRLYQYNNINELPIILKSINVGLGETTIRIKDNEIYLLSRNKSAGILSHSTLNSLNFQSVSLFTQELGGPNFIIRNDTLFLGGRLNKTTSIFSYPINSEIHDLNLLYEFPSKYPDCGYPGLFLKGKTIYGVYYTVSILDEGFQIKNFTF
jgi:hypothetical protein